jgi:hypothetical protein
MSKMRLTTLNLDDECLAVLGQHKNKSKFARECILRYEQITEEFDEMEDRYTEISYGLRTLCRFLAREENYELVVPLMAKFLDITDTEAYRLLHEPYADLHIKDEAIRLGKL